MVFCEYEHRQTRKKKTFPVFLDTRAVQPAGYNRHEGEESMTRTYPERDKQTQLVNDVRTIQQNGIGLWGEGRSSFQ